ncbi:hypothetical protein MBM_06141 [Drepanopeziza brunnea f. sp. 'multigermtubi' MB_m1]|uniref:Uncharacterized protein n=1 Tax=Marssonina brunnea f. sp. multigermtubi (strain MB_m1) TaxID=1072389 RepID=K1X492_MARBU|nr:uncharacterized protein MBM_06141 [Drepanopeziza brunnea f. sp. 'multigermtubi' MB_m1]EKD15513.1 hypothetical protein MBM_06141 [Drepanopeziza brunnea f. sp. 'multigermtubi' MB_m1]
MKSGAFSSWVIGLCSLTFVVAAPSPQLGQLGPRSQESSPNPIKSTYPSGVTGTFNSTIVVIPIPFSVARSVIPQQWGINENAYREILPGFPRDSYPLVVRSGVDHDVGVASLNFALDDFQSVHVFFPFVDLLGDGYSSFNYNKYLLLTYSNVLAIAGAGTDGTIPVPSTFKPNLEAYAYSSSQSYPGEISFDAYTTAFATNATSPSHLTVSQKYTPTWEVGPWPVNFYINVTNQPIFTRGINCDNQIFLYNTTLSTGQNAPRGIKGSVSLSAPLLPNDSTFHNIFGVKVDTAFLEKNGVPCSSLKGYHGTGPGDRGSA